MDEDEITSILESSLRHTHSTFLGVFPSDKTPSPDFIKSNSPCCYIANTDQNGLPGTHWVVVYHPTPNVLEFFDSFGSEPLDLGFHFHPTFQLIFNQRQIQRKDSVVCGQYCIYFLFFRSNGSSLKEIICRLASKTHFISDSIVCSFTQNIKSRLNIK